MDMLNAVYVKSVLAFRTFRTLALRQSKDFIRPSIEISTKTRLLEFFYQIKLYTSQPATATSPEREWRVSLLFTFFRDEKTHSTFQITNN